MATRNFEFETDVQSRIYRYVERRGAASPEDVRDAVRIEEAAGSKPARSGTEPTVRLPVGEFNEEVSALTEAGYLDQREGQLEVSPDAEPETHETDDFSYTVRPARESDREAVADRIREVAAEGAIVVDEQVADAIEREDALVRRNDQESRMFFVATSESEEGEEEVLGWVHLQSSELPARRHTAELTVGVAPDYREQGIGGNLLERGMAWADEQGYRKVYQSLPATNDDALDLLADHDWEMEATRADHYRVDGEFVDEVQLAKWL
ncbi:GNAT family N-acetyltransferase [Halorussus halophilus]|uniref:GNAT family N-acetyltransferase n=1 Tax=Halorussus halophilus TaxID=2650975 RepID=UPI0013018020|nr:GNAT family N-acetyltransferase [Halorussus halophilus]